MTPVAQRLERIFDEAIEIESPGDRQLFLECACAGDGDLFRAASKLVADHFRAGSFLESPAADIAAAIDLEPKAWSPGEQIGPYKLLEQIGEGGFGVVFLAEQERPVKRRVALKIIKPGMDTRQVIARFQAERQALAMMDHPNIAKAHDAGSTENGRPYFVMELVQGIPITEYCDQCNLTTSERLELVITVCQAVQHAHHKGIIHRDIKPNNVLVAMQNGRPTPKIIDFGVAKAIDQQLTEHTLTTAFAQMVGTPLYMSPEQAELSPLGVDTRSDIYSLGVVLYELLTGSTPFDKDRLHGAAYDELRRIIREEEPPRPSARISTLAADKASTLAEHRRTDARRLSQQVRGELDWIVMKCLEKDRNRRYETPASLARDIERYLHDEPVQACPASASYRVQKFVCRNKTLLAFGGAIAAALVVGLGLATWQYIRATAERARADAVSDMMKEIMAPSDREPLQRSQNAVRELVQDFSAGLGDQLAGEPEVEHVIRTIIDNANWRLGVYGRAGPIPEAEYAVSYSWLANYLAANNRHDEAKALLRKATDYLDHAVCRGLAPAYHVNALFYLAIVRLRLGDDAGYRDTCAAMLRVPVDNSDDSVPYQRVVIWGLGPHPGEDLSERIKEAEELVADSSAAFDHPSTDLGVLGGLLYRADRYEQAAQRLNEAIAAHKDDPLRAFRTTIDWQLLLAMTNWRLGQQEEARRQLAEIQPALDEWLGSPSTFWIRRAQVEILRQEAENLITRKKSDAAPNHE
jgi:serine/threonine protein kinase